MRVLRGKAPSRPTTASRTQTLVRHVPAPHALLLWLAAAAVAAEMVMHGSATPAVPGAAEAAALPPPPRRFGALRGEGAGRRLCRRGGAGGAGGGAASAAADAAIVAAADATAADAAPSATGIAATVSALLPSDAAVRTSASLSAALTVAGLGTRHSRLHKGPPQCVVRDPRAWETADRHTAKSRRAGRGEALGGTTHNGCPLARTRMSAAPTANRIASTWWYTSPELLRLLVC